MLVLVIYTNPLPPPSSSSSSLLLLLLLTSYLSSHCDEMESGWGGLLAIRSMTAVRAIETWGGGGRTGEEEDEE